ncbi:ZIP family metal transporter [Mycoplasmopsis meleagridis]|uniref:ZIP family metal transporter n=1 Tax=Mycoplasmopsis meleagridis TaxID=29561 RepID=UPI00073D358E|nr:ZIP family metal transporter [Mycoplasmopsis meleagridis]KUH47555.1 hypothetical protein ASB56_00250 [Mycoplasmopsis meleagridis]
MSNFKNAIFNLVERLKSAHGNLLDIWNAESETHLAQFYITLLGFIVFLIIPLLICLILPFVKKKQLSKKASVILYAFSTGFFIAMAVFGFLREALEVSTTKINVPSIAATYGWNILLVGGGVIVGIVLAFSLRQLVRYIYSLKSIKNDPKAVALIHFHTIEHSNDSQTHHNHDIAPSHSTENNHLETNQKTKASNKVVALLLLLTHRIPSGLFIGYSLNSFAGFSIGTSSTLGFAFLVSFILHIIPEILIFYFRQREMGYSPWKASLWSIASLLIFLPLLLIGMYFGSYINYYPQIMAFANALIGGVFIFTAIVEFLPEFYHSHHDKKIFSKVLLTFFLGFITCIIILSFHSHGG